MKDFFPPVLPTQDDIDLSGGWDEVWSEVESTLGDITTLMTVVGVVLVVFAIGSWLWERRRGGGMGGQGNSKLLWTGLFGAALAAPAVIFPIGLTLLDLFLNFLVGFLPND